MPCENGTTCRADESRSRDYRGTEGNGSDEIGWLDEQCKECCGGSCGNGTDMCVIMCGVGNCSALLRKLKIIVG